MKIIIIIFFIVVAAVVGFVIGVKQNILPISLPESVTNPTPLRKAFQGNAKLQGYWKLEEMWQEDAEGNFKKIRWSTPGATDNYFSFEKEHVCTDGQVDTHS